MKAEVLYAQFDVYQELYLFILAIGHLAQMAPFSHFKEGGSTV
jgi:hypothetical protein